MNPLITLALFCSLPAGLRQADTAPAELVLLGARVVTLAAAPAEAEAIALRGEHIQAVGSRAAIEALCGPETRRLELPEGALVIPGFIEGHGHFLSLGRQQLELDLTKTRSFEEIVARVAEEVRTRAPGEPIRGRGWHQDKWDAPPSGAVDGLPPHAALSAVSPENPVVLVHASGHAALANARAMELAGIDASTPDPKGGTIVHDPSGAPLGAFLETAAGLLDRALEGAPEASIERLVELASREVLAKGITSFQDAGTPLASVRELRRLAEQGKLELRLWIMVRDSTAHLRDGLTGARVIGLANGYFTVRAIKESIDGALGSHGAWLLAPYSDLPSSSGLNTLPLEVLRQSAALALQHDMQLCVHAIGDRANREVLDLYRAAFGAKETRSDLRWRIEHAQHLDPADVPRFAAMGVIASMQAVHCTSDGPWVPTRLGEERTGSGAYVWRSLLDSGAVVTNGTDAPVEDVDPLPSFIAAVTRRMANGERFHPEQCMTRMEALRSYTLSNAYAAFEEEEKGSLAPGKLADLTVLSQDILSVTEEALPGTQVLYTIVGGKVRYAR